MLVNRGKTPPLAAWSTSHAHPYLSARCLARVPCELGALYQRLRWRILIPITNGQKCGKCFLYPGYQRMLTERGGAASTWRHTYLGTCSSSRGPQYREALWGRGEGLLKCTLLSLFQNFWIRISGGYDRRKGIFTLFPRQSALRKLFCGSA